jgi:hypothetical protein
VLILISAILCLFATGCARPGCVNKVREVMASPDGRMKLVVFLRECGGTESNLQASVLEAAEKLPERGANAVVVDDGEVKFAWQPDGGVLVTYEKGARFYKQEPEARGIHFEYREKK